MKQYEYHELASLLPLLDDDDFDSLVEDIREYGQIEPITLYEGKILDGRNRYRACQELGIEPKVKEWKPSDSTGLTPLQYVISENIMRRHLNTAQRAEIALILLPEIEEEAKERQKEMTPLKMQLSDQNLSKEEKSILEEKISNIAKGEQSSAIAGKKTKISSNVVAQAKKVAEVAETEPLIKQEWEKAKQGEQSVDTVYQKAKIVEKAQQLPPKQKKEVMDVLKKEEIATKDLRKFVQEKKDDSERLELAKQNAALLKKKQEMAQLLKTIESHEAKIEDFKGKIKQSEANLDVLTKEVISKYPTWKDKDASYVLTQLNLLYDSLDTTTFNDQIRILRNEYEAKINPLKERIRKLEEEFASKKKAITESKTKVESQLKTIERYEDLMAKEFDNIDWYKQEINEKGIIVKKLLKEYDEKYKKETSK